MKHASIMRRLAWALPFITLLGACSGIPLKEREAIERQRIEAYAGQPVDHFTWMGRYDGWKPVSRNELLVWTTPNDAYLIQVSPLCEDLRFANRIGLTSTLHTVYSRRLDYVIVRGDRCPIELIRPVDYGQLKQDLRQQLQQAKSAGSESTEEKSG